MSEMKKKVWYCHYEDRIYLGYEVEPKTWLLFLTPDSYKFNPIFEYSLLENGWIDLGDL